MKALRGIILALLVMVVISIVMRWQRLPFGAITTVIFLNIFSLTMIAQAILSGVKITNIPLQMTGMFCSIGLAVAGIGNLFRFLFWPFWGPLLYLSSPVLLIGGAMIFFNYMRSGSDQEEKEFLKKNIMLPWIIITVLTSISLFTPKAAFYYAIHSKRDIQTYEEYLEKGKLSNQEANKKTMNGTH
jgi:hypothetical protein